MSAYLSHLPAAPWRFRFDRESGSFYVCGEDGFPILLAERDDEAGGAALEMSALLRNAYDVQMRRGWTSVRGVDGWWLDATWDKADDMDNWHPTPFQEWLRDRHWPDPAAALTEADEWYKTNVEQKE